MKLLRNFFLNLIIVVTMIATFVFLYQSYKDSVIDYFTGDSKVGILVRDVTFTVSIADTPEERYQGLSGVAELPTLEGKLFIFDTEGQYGFWMKDMVIPLDIIWINNDRKIVHIEEGIRPDSYPAVFSSPTPARFVLEINAHLVSTFNINVGDTVLIPSNKLPRDLRY